MKSEHRHELKQNDLDRSLADLPGFFKRHGSKVFLVLAVAMLVVFVVRYRNNRAAELDQALYMSLASANNAISQLQRVEETYAQQRMQLLQMQRSPAWATLSDAERQQLGGAVRPELILGARQQAENEVRLGVQNVIDNADPKDHAAVLASAWETQGELYWLLATAEPVSPAPATQPAATQPGLAPALKSASEYLALSKQAYQHVLDQYVKQARSVANARLSLAAIAETEHDFDAARKYYQAVVDAADSPSLEKGVATTRLDEVGNLAKPLLLAAPQPATQPTAALPPLGNDLPLMPTFTGPTTAPADTQSTTRPAR